ncbi:MAG: hypothetical protein AB4042_03990 [Leptolyngbyaceae cyanobacterium]
MNHQLPSASGLGDWGILVVLWAIAAVIDHVWLALDHAPPSWDPADHMIGALNYWWTLQPQHWFSGHIWDALWTLSSKYPPLLYISTAPFLALLGRGADQAIAVNLFYTAILLISVYGLGRVLFRAEVGRWAAGLCLLFPQFYSLRTGYYMDYPLTTLIAASSLILTGWHFSHLSTTRPPRSIPHRFTAVKQWGLALSFGVTFGLALLMKQTAVFFLAVPLVWVGVPSLVLGIRQRRWAKFSQIFSGVAIAFLMIWPWSQTNWLFQISAAFNSNIKSARIEGDPAWNTLAGWTYYWQQLPQALSYPLLIVALVGLLIALLTTLIRFLAPPNFKTSQHPNTPTPQRKTPPFLWFLFFFLPTYAIWSAIANKDSRYILPWLSWWSVLLAYGLLSFPRTWWRVKWITVSVASLAMLLNLFPVGGDWGRAIATTLAPGAYQPPYLGEPWPQAEIIDEIIQTQPYQVANIGVLPSTPEMNQHNLTLEGNRRNFQVYARRMGRDRDYLQRDQRSLSWFLSVTAPNLNHHEESSRQRQRQMRNEMKQSGQFKRQRVWDLPDGSRLLLFRRQQLPVEVEPLENPITDVLYDRDKLDTLLSLFGANQHQADSQTGSATPVAIQPLTVQLDEIKAPRQVPPGQPVPITYTWSGSWSVLHDGVVLLTWHRQGSPVGDPTRCSPETCWFHDHAIGLGTLYPQIIQANQAIAAPTPPDRDPLQPFTVTERTAMLPPATLKPGRYTLAATYINPVTGETYELDGPAIAIRINPSAKAKAAPELDWISQFRAAAQQLPLGIDALNQVFDNLGRINLYDPVQAYTQQAEVILKARLQHQPDNRADHYGLVLAHALQRDVQGTLTALEKTAQLDADNPYVHAQLGFVRLYAGQPWAAQEALDRAIALDPTVPEIQTLNAVAALLRGNLWQAWTRFRT